ncbi:MmgE/PrpD family protein [Geodermatophilus sp. DSM 44513]|uniref:MmgE/PrpD family protein n=1 Tax=Geodermatophilus sp. DSM 44513 TaxID=1528104 RepID=UPI00127B65A0|nr:MmgE/PrpD family protein [Geodermatophilus sp. DSM 44513]WNV74184.1 MmgE/PrpD family protein [Geodermatophilus sp. DSM 44513]
MTALQPAPAQPGARPALTAQLVDWAAGLRPADLPDAVVHQAKRVLLDYVAATLVGSTSGAARIVQRFVAETEGPGPATVLGTALRATAPSAALVNGTATHGLEVDDGYTPGSTHPGGPIGSAVLAVAEARGADPEELLLAMAVGLELTCRIGGAGHPATWRRGFHNTPVNGVFGAAAAAARLLGADRAALADALGIAGSHAGGLFEFLHGGGEVKRLHPGKAARDGIVSAELAVRGLTGPTTVLEGPNGYLHAFADDRYDAEHLVGGLGSDWRMLGMYVKPYPCCRHLHGPIDAILAMAAEEPLDPAGVESVRVETFPAAARHGGKRIDDLISAQMSIPYAVATTVVHGVPGLEHFGDEARADPRIARIVDVVEVEEAEDCVRDYPAMRPARVTVRAGGRERVLRIDQPYGEPSNPMSDADLERKLHRLAGPVVGDRRCADIAAAVWALDDPARLFALLGAPGDVR